MSEISKVHQGGCYCGEIRFQIEEPIESSGMCHCGNCRKAIGAQSVAWILVKKDQFKVTRGVIKRYPTDTGAHRGFCPSCGTSITYESPKRMDEIDVTTGSMDDPEAFPPEWDAFDDEKVTWVRKVNEQ